MSDGMNPIEAAADATGTDYEGVELLATAHARNYNRWILDAIRPHVGHSIAEVGAGRGNFTRELLRLEPARIIAIEPSRHLFPALRRAIAGDARVEPRRGTLAELAAEIHGAVDSVVYVNVLEHIRDDRAELLAANRALGPGGVLIVFAPALPQLYTRFDQAVGHCRRYRKRELESLARDCGFEPLFVRWFDLLGIAAWALAFGVLRMGMTSGPVGFYDRVAVPLARRLDRLAGPPIGKSLLLIARKP